jgi:hypothetical protein
MINTMKKIIIISLLFLLSPLVTLAATLSISPSTGVYTAGATFTVRVVVNTSGKPVNAAEGTLKFNPQELSVVSVDRSGSIFNLWVAEPSFSNSAGTINFSGGLPSGYTGAAGNIFNVTFRTRGAGNPRVSITNGSVLANDGMGTNVLTAMNGGSYTVSATSNTPEPEVIEYVAPANTPASPKITSSTHPDEKAWYKSTTAEIKWDLPGDVVAIRTLLDSKPSSVPTKVYENPISSITLPDLEEGESYFHIQFKNADGWGRVAHYRLAVDSSAPTKLEIGRANDTDPANPIQVLEVKSDESVSALVRYLVRLDANEPFEVTEVSASSTIILPSVNPGHHTVIIEAFDAAGNSVVGSYSFTIDAFAKPEFTEYPTEINETVIPVIKGSTRADSEVEVTLQKLGAEPERVIVMSDENGQFIFIPGTRLSTGVYELSAIAKDSYGAQSEVSEVVRIAVQQPGFMRVGSYLVSVLSVVIPLVAMTVFLVLMTWFMIMYYRRYKKKLGRESGEVMEVVVGEFARLNNLVQKLKTETATSRKTNKLTKIEEKIFNEIESAVIDSRRKIEKEVSDVVELVDNDNSKSK